MPKDISDMVQAYNIFKASQTRKTPEDLAASVEQPGETVLQLPEVKEERECSPAVMSAEAT